MKRASNHKDLIYFSTKYYLNEKYMLLNEFSFNYNVSLRIKLSELFLYVLWDILIKHIVLMEQEKESKRNNKQAFSLNYLPLLVEITHTESMRRMKQISAYEMFVPNWPLISQLSSAPQKGEEGSALNMNCCSR